MSHFRVTVCLPSETVDQDIKTVLDDVLVRWDENRAVDPYRDYEDGAAEDFWWVSSVRRGAKKHRENAPVEILNRELDRNGKVWRSGMGYITPEEYERITRKDRADDALWDERLGAEPTWGTVVRLYNEKWGHEKALAATGDDSDSDRLHYEPETDRAYNMSTRNPESMWDWWAIGGRWRGRLHAAPGVDASVVYIADRHWGEAAPADPIADRWAPNGGLRCDGGPKRFLDLDSVRDQAEAEANDLYDAWEKLSTGIPAAQRWGHFYDLVQAVGWTGIRRASSTVPSRSSSRCATAPTTGSSGWTTLSAPSGSGARSTCGWSD